MRKITGNPNKGVIFAGRVGQAIGWLAIIMGGLSFFQTGNGLWTLLIGWFLLRNAGFAAQSAKVQDKLDQYTAKDAVFADSPLVSDNLTVREFVNDYVIGQQRWKKFLVANEQGTLIGEIDTQDLKQVPTSQWNEIHLSELVQPLKEITTVLDTTSLLEVAKQLETSDFRELAVVTEAGVIIGLLDKSSIIDLMAQETKEKIEPQEVSPEKPEKTYIN